MTQLTFTLPTVGQPNSTQDPLIRTALSDIKDSVNGNIDSTNLGTDSVGSAQIAANAVGSSEIAADAVGSSEIATDAVTSTEIAEDAVGTAEIATNSVTSDGIAPDAVGSSEIAADAVGASEIASLAITDAEVATANKDGVAATPSMRTLGTGATQAAAGDDTRFGGVGGSGPPSGAATGVLDGSYPGPGLAASVAGAGLTETTNVLSVNVDDSTLQMNVDTLRVKASGITTNEIATDGVGTAEIANLAVTAAKIANDTITASQIATDAVGTIELAADAVVNANVASGAGIVDAKLASPNNSAYRTILQANSILSDTAIGATTLRLGSQNDVPSSYFSPLTANNWSPTGGSSAVAPPMIYFDDADYLVGSLTQKLRIRALVAANATAPGITFTFGLYPVTSAGVADNLNLGLGTVVSSSTVAIASPSASTITSGVNTDFTIPADGAYILGCAVSGSLTANSVVTMHGLLQSRNV